MYIRKLNKKPVYDNLYSWNNGQVKGMMNIDFCSLYFVDLVYKLLLGSLPTKKSATFRSRFFVSTVYI